MEESLTLTTFKKGAIIIFVTGFSLVFGYLNRFLFAHYLTKEEYGLFYSVLAFYGLLLLFSDLGLGQSSVYFISNLLSKKKNSLAKYVYSLYWRTRAMLSSIIFVLVIFLSNYLSIYFFKSDKATLFLFVLGVCWVLGNIRPVILSLFQGAGKQEYPAYANFLWISLIFVFSFILFNLGLGYLSPLLSYLLSHSLVLIWTNFKAGKLFGTILFLPSKKSPSLKKKIFSYGFSLLLGYLAGLIIGYTDTLTLTALTSLSIVATYNIAQPTARLLWVFTTSFTSVIFPLIVGLHAKKQKRKIREFLFSIYKIPLFLTMPFFIMLFLFSKEILFLFFGKSFVDGELTLKILSIGALLFSIMQLNLVSLNAIGKANLTAKYVFIGALFNLIANLLLIPIFGMEGAAISTVITYFIILMLSTYGCKKLLNIKYPLHSWIAFFLSGMLSYFVILFVKTFIQNIFLKISICLFLSLSIYFIFCILLRGISLSEIHTFLKRFRK